jgi:hypothetical protein
MTGHEHYEDETQAPTPEEIAPYDGSRRLTAPTPRSTPCYNLISVGAPFLGLLGGIGSFCLPGGGGHPEWTWRAGLGIGILELAGLIGFLSALKALVRSEKLWGLTVFGLILNAPFVALLFYWALLGLGWVISNG